VLLHGGPGGQKDGPEGLYDTLARILAMRSIASLRFDFSGAGESTGEYRNMTIAGQITEFETTWQFARSLGFNKVGVVGESYGATIALGSTLVDPDAVCLLWPAIYLLDVTFAPYVTDSKMAEARQKGFIVEEDAEVGLPFLEEVLELKDVESGVKRLKVPTLLIHGTDDSEVPYRQSERAYDLLAEPRRLVPVSGGDHCLIEPAEREVVNEEVPGWLAQHLL
jgi:pimeloyl-ACP methyl ester carboxylesterase